MSVDRVTYPCDNCVMRGACRMHGCLDAAAQAAQQAKMERDARVAQRRGKSFLGGWLAPATPCHLCGFPFDQERLGRWGCPNCEGVELGYGGHEIEFAWFDELNAMDHDAAFRAFESMTKSLSDMAVLHVEQDEETLRLIRFARRVYAGVGFFFFFILALVVIKLCS